MTLTHAQSILIAMAIQCQHAGHIQDALALDLAIEAITALHRHQRGRRATQIFTLPHETKEFPQ